MPRRKTLDEVMAYYATHGAILLATEYVNNYTLMPFICSCGEQHTLSYNMFQQGVRCPYCSHGKYTVQEVKAIFDAANCILLTSEYVDNKMLLPFICACGKRHAKRLSHFQQHPYCAECGRNTTRGYTQAAIAELWQQWGCEIISHTGYNTPTKFICSCGKLDTVLLKPKTVLQPRVCRWCKQERRQSSYWARNCGEYYGWRKAVLIRDDYTCQKCSEINNLQAHHVESWLYNPDKRFVLDNGVTLCQECHQQVHAELLLTATWLDFISFMEAA